MKLNRVLHADMLASQLGKYRASIVIAENKPIEPARHRQPVKDFLTTFDHHDEFYTETNLHQQQITWVHGINKWLGYDADKPDTQHLPIDYVAGLVHPVIRDWYRTYVNAATLVFCSNQTTYLKSRFSITIPVQKANGEYVLIKQMSMPFGKDTNGKWVSFINSFTVFGAYRGEPLKLELFEAHKKIEGDMMKQFHDLVKSCCKVPKSKNLTKDHFSIIDIINELKQAGEEINTKNIKKLFTSSKAHKIETDAITKALNRLKSKLMWLLRLDDPELEDKATYNKEYLPRHKTPFQLIEYCEQSGILHLLRP